MSVSSASIRPGYEVPDESSSSAISWAAIIGGAVVAAAIGIILLAFGSGIGLASVSPWPNAGASVTSFTVMTGIWLIVVQWVASGLGGYITGRLRTKWVDLHTHEVFFRDTAHGFLTWAVASLGTILVIAYAASSIASGAAHTAGTVAAGASQGAMQSNAAGGNAAAYDLDTLFRSDTPNGNAPASDARMETGRILAHSLGDAGISADDRTYLAWLVAARTGISQADAEKRVDDVVAKEKAAEAEARQLADQARKAGAAFAIYSFLSMLIGAFIASVAAALGGKQRDEF